MLNLTARTLDGLAITLGEPATDPRAGLLVPAALDGYPITLALSSAGHLAGRPFLLQINGVTYDMSWWATRDGNPHATPTATGWRNRSLRLQRAGSAAIRAYTPAAFRLGCRLMDAIIDTVVADAGLLARTERVEAERELAAAELVYDRALRALEEAEAAVRGAEGRLEILEGRLAAPTLAALPAGKRNG